MFIAIIHPNETTQEFEASHNGQDAAVKFSSGTPLGAVRSHSAASTEVVLAESLMDKLYAAFASTRITLAAEPQYLERSDERNREKLVVRMFC
jgi:hypothetical protein